MARTGITYLIHFAAPFGHARHYCGSAVNLEKRLKHHKHNSGANLLRYVNNAGINWYVVRTWDGGHALEKRIKKQGGLSRCCPVCRHLQPRYYNNAAGEGWHMPADMITPLPIEAERLRIIRQSQHIKRDALAQLLNVSSRTLYRWERGHVQMPETVLFNGRAMLLADALTALEHGAARE